jgi:heme-degrading monooxygenase HmoA
VWVRMNRLKTDPARLDEVRTFYNGEEVSGFARRQKGYRFHYLLESVNESGELVSLTSWDSREDAEVFERSEAYSAALGKLGQYLVARPEIETYEVRE